jgi:acyl carrier protein
MDQVERSALRTEVMAALASIARVDLTQIHEGMSLSEAHIDSLGLVEAVFEIESRFNIAIPYNANERDTGSGSMLTIGQLVDQVVELVASKPKGEAEGDGEALAAGMPSPATKAA